MSAAQAVHSGAGRSATVNAGTQRQLSSWKPLRSGQKNALLHGSENYFNSLVEQHQKTKALAKRSYATLASMPCHPLHGTGERPPMYQSSCRQQLVVTALSALPPRHKAHDEGAHSCCGCRGDCQHCQAPDRPQLKTQHGGTREIQQVQGMPSSNAHIPVHFAPCGGAILAGEELSLNTPLDLSRVAGDVATVGAHNLVHSRQGIVCVVVQLVCFVLRGVAPAVERVHHRVSLLLQMRSLIMELVCDCKLWIQLGSQCFLQLVVQTLFHRIDFKTNLGH